MTKPKTTLKTKAIDRKRISEALLADRLGLNEEWIERWEERGKIREESHMPDRLPAFIHKNYGKDEIEDIGREVERLVAAGCRRQVVYFCLAQLSPEAIRLRGGLAKKQAVMDADYLMFAEPHLAPREDLEVVANTAKAARKQIHHYQRELFLVAESSNYPLPVGFECRPKTAIEALDLLQDSLTWAAALADAYIAPMEATLLKSKGLLYLTAYVSMSANSKKLHGSRISSLHRDSSKPSGRVRSRRTFHAENPFTSLVNLFTDQQRDWSASDLYRKLSDFEEDHPRLNQRLTKKLKELHDFASE